MNGEPPLDGSIITLRFPPDGRLSGSAGCNYYSGEVTATQDALRVEPLAVTLMGCPEPLGVQEIGPVGMTEQACLEPAGVMEQELAVAKTLESATSYRAGGDALHLYTDDGVTAVRPTRY